MTRAVLLDANLLIGAFDSAAGNEEHQRSKERLRELLLDPEVKVAISPLIRYEVLRGAKCDFDELDEKLSDFHEFEVSGRDARRAAEIFRRAVAADMKLDKRKFDVFHCVCAEINELEILSRDGDIEKIQNLMKAVDENAQAH